ncbi:hypothetical protein H5410_028297, partial [Solanum commersonii]
QIAVYPKFLNSTLNMKESARFCNALIVFQCMAYHPDARMGLLKGFVILQCYLHQQIASNTVLFNAENIQYFLYPFLRISTNVMRPLLSFVSVRLRYITERNQICIIRMSIDEIYSCIKEQIALLCLPYYLYPFLQISTNVMKPLQFVRLSILSLIASLAKFDESYGQEILLLLLDTQVFPLCLHCIHHGDQPIPKVRPAYNFIFYDRRSRDSRNAASVSVES